MPETGQSLELENKMLLAELEMAYKNMESILEQANKEKEITYRELQHRYNTLQSLYEELSNKENMLVHMEKLSSIGQFITEIIHELNNPLMVIAGVTDLVLMGEELPEKTRERISRIPQQVDRMKSYLNRFRNMVYKSDEDFEVFDLNHNLNDFITTIEIIKPKNIRIENDLSADLLYVHGDAYQLFQIYLNLAKNAFDAMQDKGTCLKISSLRADRYYLQNSELATAVHSEGDESWEQFVESAESFVVVTLEDDGPGMDTETLARIFDAFFTTKGRGSGTGLGLSIARDICQRHKGELAVTSQPDVGTRFFIVLPLTTSRPETIY